MERTNFVTKLISAILFLALAVYFCVYIVRSFTDTYSTTPAVLYTVGDSYSAQGIIIRRESLFTTSESYVTITADEGQKVAAGDPVATSFGSENEQTLAERISSLEAEIEQLQKYADTGESIQSSDIQDSTIKDTIMEMNYNLGRDEMNKLEEQVIILRSLIFSGDLDDTRGKIASLQSQADTLRGQLGSGGKAISIDSSGIFSRNVDGYEDISPSDIENLTVTDLRALMERSPALNANALGKLATGINWYLTTVMPEDKAQKLADILESERPDKSVEVNLSGIGTGTYTMSIERVDMNGGDDGCVVVLSCNYALGETFSARITEAEVIYSNKTGMRVPRDAVYVDDEGNSFVYTETALQAELHYVDIIHEYGDYFLIQSSDKDRAPLREGAEIIIEAEGLYDGKVISK